MGGAAAFEATRYLRFDLAVVREHQVVARYAHWWDRWTGDYRVEGGLGKDRRFMVRFDLDTRQGDAWINDEPVTDAGERDELLEMAYGRYASDSLWLLMPWKWDDPGVTLTLESPREIEGTTFDVVRLTLGPAAGLAPDARYWGWVSRDTGLMERWQFVLPTEDGTPGSSHPAGFEWQRWVETESGLLLSRTKRSLDADPPYVIDLPVLETLGDVLSDEERSAFLAGGPLSPPRSSE